MLRAAAGAAEEVWVVDGAAEDVASLGRGVATPEGGHRGQRSHTGHHSPCLLHHIPFVVVTFVRLPALRALIGCPSRSVKIR